MQGSKSLSKRKREVDAEEQGEREARQLRREMRMRGHVVRCLQPLPSQLTAPLVSPHWTCMQHISVVHAAPSCPARLHFTIRLDGGRRP